MGVILGPIGESTLKNPTSLVPASQSPSSLPIIHCTPAIIALSAPTPSSLIPISVVLTFTTTRSNHYHPLCWPHDHCHQNLLQQLSSTPVPVPRSPALSHPALSGMTRLRQDGPCFQRPHQAHYPRLTSLGTMWLWKSRVWSQQGSHTLSTGCPVAKAITGCFYLPTWSALLTWLLADSLTCLG